MKLTGVVLTSENTVDPIVLSFRDPSNQNPYQVKSIVGLDADEIGKRYYGLQIGGSGGKSYDLRLKKRDIIVNIGLNPRWAIEENYSILRDDIYRLVSSSRGSSVIVNFMNDTAVVATLNGFISKVEASHFVKIPDVKLTIDCPDPLLRSPTQVIVPNVQSLDVANTVITDALSTAPHGLNMGVKFLENASVFSISNSGWVFMVNYSFLADDVIYICNDLGPKSIWVTRNGIATYIADRIAEGFTIWPILFPGINNFVLSDDTQWNIIEYTPTYWGV